MDTTGRILFEDRYDDERVLPHLRKCGARTSPDGPNRLLEEARSYGWRAWPPPTGRSPAHGPVRPCADDAGIGPRWPLRLVSP